jgi:hypothetical protein
MMTKTSGSKAPAAARLDLFQRELELKFPSSRHGLSRCKNSRAAAQLPAVLR